MDALRRALLRYLTENYEDLLKLDLTLARLLGAPNPHTLSSYAYKRAQEGSRWGKVWRIIIDLFFLWLKQEREHCKKDYVRVSGRTS